MKSRIALFGLVALLSCAAFASATTANDRSCTFDLDKTQITFKVTYHSAEQCYSSEVSSREGTRRFDCKHTETGTVKGDEIDRWPENQWLLRKVGLNPLDVASFTYYKAELDGDGGALILMDVVEKSATGTRNLLKLAFTYMGGAMGFNCR